MTDPKQEPDHCLPRPGTIMSAVDLHLIDEWGRWRLYRTSDGSYLKTFVHKSGEEEVVSVGENRTDSIPGTDPLLLSATPPHVRDVVQHCDVQPILTYNGQQFQVADGFTVSVSKSTTHDEIYCSITTPCATRLTIESTTNGYLVVHSEHTKTPVWILAAFITTEIHTALRYSNSILLSELRWQEVHR